MESKERPKATRGVLESERKREELEYDEFLHQISMERKAKVAPLSQLIERNNAVLDGIFSLSKNAEPIIRPFSKETWSKVIVNIGPAKISTTTPNHTVLCGVSFIQGNYRSDKHGLSRNGAHFSNETLQRGEFAYAVVPTGDVDFFIQNPHALHDPNKRDVMRSNPEPTLDEAQILHAMEDNVDDFSVLGLPRKRRVNDFSNRVRQSEKNLEKVIAAAIDPVLNPHLQDSVRQEV